MLFAQACARRKEPVKFTAKVLEMFWSEVVRNGSSLAMPAALTLMSIDGKADSISDIVCWTFSREVMSVL